MRLRFVAPFVALSFVAAGSCSRKQVVQTETNIAKALISDEQEDALGLAVKSELDKQGIKLLEEPDVQSYLDGIGRKIFPQAQNDRKGVKWHIHLVDDDKMVNAFATPGGHLYFTTGLLLAADDEAEVAGVLAHEAGHVVARHSARALVQQFGLQTVAAMALGENPNAVAAVAANIGASGLMLAHSRSSEHEADVFGVKYSARAGYDPRGIIRFFQKLKAKEGKTPKVLAWLSTHPATGERIAHVEDIIEDKKLASGKRNEMRHKAVKDILESGQKPVRGTEPMRAPAPAHKHKH